jgi:hypothetical protein
MRESFHILFNFDSGRWPDARRFFEAIGRPDLAAGPEQKFGYTFDFDSRGALESFRSHAARFGFADDYNVRRDRHYSAQDLSAAPLLWLSISTKPTGEGGPACGTRYDLSAACPACGSGARQIPPLILRDADLPASKAGAAVTEEQEILFHEDAAARLLEGGFPPEALGPVSACEGGGALPWRQLLPLGDLPPMSRETEGLVRDSGCPVCGRDGYYANNESPILIRYDAGALDPETLPPVVATWERFGNSWLRSPIEESRFAPPLVVVKQELYRILRPLKLRGLEFTPVELVG